MTHYGRVEAYFSTISDGTSIIDEVTYETIDGAFVAKVAITPGVGRPYPYRVVFDINPTLDPATKITYQAIIPSDSEVFKIVASGQVKKLIEALELGTTSLTDRDEEGRSLLNVSCHEASFSRGVVTLE